MGGLMDFNALAKLGSRNGVTWEAVLFWGLALVSLFASLGSRELWMSENRWAEISRVMFAHGNYFQPSINGAPYFLKPLFSYWAIVGLAEITGSVSEFTSRAPSAVAGLFALWATRRLGAQLWSRAEGNLAGWILLSTQGFLFWARTAQADMANLAFCILAIGWFWGRRERLGLVTWVVFYSLCFVGAQFKGLGAIAVPLVAIAPYMIRGGRWRAVWSWGHLCGFGLGAVLYVVPFAVASMVRGTYGQSGLAMVWRQNVERFFTPFDHMQPFYVYFYHLPVLFLPWTPLLVIALIAAVAGWRRVSTVSGPTRWAVEATLLVFLFFTLSGSRRSYYILPLLPMCALVCSRFFLSSGYRRLHYAARGIHIYIPMVGSVATLVFCAVVIWLLPPGQRWSVGLGWGAMAGLVLLVACGAVMVVRPWRPTILSTAMGMEADRAAGALGTALLMAGLFVGPLVTMDALGTTRTFAVGAAGSATGDLAFYGVDDISTPTILFYLDQAPRLPILKTSEDLRGFLLQSPGMNGVLLKREDVGSLTEKVGEGVEFRSVIVEADSRFESKESKSGKWLMMTATRRDGLGELGPAERP